MRHLLNIIYYNLKKLMLIIIFLFISCSKTNQENQDYTVKTLKENNNIESVYFDFLNRKNNINAKQISSTKDYSVDSIQSFLSEFEMHGGNGNDNRKNFYELNNDIKSEVNKVAIIIDKSQLDERSNYSIIKPTKKLFEELNLCDKQKFYSETIIKDAFSGFAISNKYIVTAGHCVDVNKIMDKRIIFGYYTISANECQIEIQNEDIYRISRIVGREVDFAAKIDYAILEINMEISPSGIPSNRVVNYDPNNNPLNGSQLFMIGYPLGLPVKYCDDALVYKSDNNNFFKSDLDAFEGNSGSPVYSYDVNRRPIVVGILIDSPLDTDSKYINGVRCKVYKFYPKLIATNIDLYGARVSKISQILRTIN